MNYHIKIFKNNVGKIVVLIKTDTEKYCKCLISEQLVIQWENVDLNQFDLVRNQKRVKYDSIHNFENDEQLAKYLISILNLKCKVDIKSTKSRFKKSQPPKHFISLSYEDKCKWLMKDTEAILKTHLAKQKERKSP